MKYILQAIKKTGAWKCVVASIVIHLAYLGINAKILYWISQCMESTTWEEALHYEWLIIIFCGINTVLNTALRLVQIDKLLVASELNKMLGHKVLSVDSSTFTQIPPSDFQHTAGHIKHYANVMQFFNGCVHNGMTIVVNIIAIALIDNTKMPAILTCYLISAIALFLVNIQWNKADAEFDDMKRKRNHVYDDVTNGYLEVRSYPQMLNKMNNYLYELNDSIVKLGKKRNRWHGVLDFITSVADTGATIILLAYAMTLVVTEKPVMASSEGLALIMYAWRIIEPLSYFVDNMSSISEIRAALPMLNKIMKIQPKIISGAYVLEQFTAGIEFRNVYFQYNSHNGYVLKDINIRINVGDNIGICGGSGGGKTTFLELIPRFYDVTEGSILIDGVDVKSMDINSLRAQIGIVHQTCYIFDNTIRYNITFPITDREVSEDELQRACKSAGILDYIMSLKDGFDTDVGPRGLKLSGGQKQRIQLARLFLVNPAIVILDEATSALDPETELIFQEALSMFKDKTVITVAHRLQTIQDCDCIYVLDKDTHTISEFGTHDELMALKGQYYRMQTIKG